MYKIFFVCCLFLFSQSVPAWSQASGEERKEDAFKQLKELKEGILLVRLMTGNRQREALKRRFSNSNSAEAKARLEERLRAVEDNAVKWRSALKNSVKELYDYSQVYYVYDTSMYALQDQQYEGRIWTKDDKAVPVSELEGRTLFVLARVNHDSERAISTEGLAIWRLDNPSRPIAPFPYFSKLSYRLFSPMTPEVVDIAHRRAVRSWVKKLERLEEASEQK